MKIIIGEGSCGIAAGAAKIMTIWENMRSLRSFPSQAALGCVTWNLL